MLGNMKILILFYIIIVIIIVIIILNFIRMFLSVNMHKFCNFVVYLEASIQGFSLK